VPWFWSDQFELRLQMAGLAFDAHEVVVRGDADGPGFAVFHLDPAHRVLAVEAVNAPADFMAGRLLVAKQARVSPATLRDQAQPLRDLTA
jgi:3-phenylpropionate/trans-cinnamate dioxygenase ferredoxin reductase subunit